MVHFKELRNKDLTYLAIADRETEDGSSGTRLVTRPSLRSSKGEVSVVDKNCFNPEMSSKFDIAKQDVSACFLLRSTFKTKVDENPSFPLLGRRIIAGSVKWGSNNLKIYGESKHIVGYWEWTEDVLARFGDTLEEVRVRSFRYSFEKIVGEFETFKMAH